MAQSYVCLHYHLIFSTHRREPTLTEALRPRLYTYVGGILRAEKAGLHAAGGTSDHTHWLVSLHQGTSVANALRMIKACSSKWIHGTFPELRHFAWQAGYGAFGVSDSNLDAVRRDIEGQSEHHRTMTFREEFLLLLRRHEVPFDEHYLWQ